MLPSEDSDSEEDAANLGNKLFDSDSDAEANGNGNAHNQATELHKIDDPVLARAMLAQDSPELQGLLTELKDTLETASQKLQPLLKKAKAGEVESNAAGISYLEMKYNLMMSYCTFLSFYVLLKLDGKDVTNHPVLFKLAHMRTLLEKLKPLDDKLQHQLDKMMDKAEEEEETLKYNSKHEELKIDDESYGNEDEEMSGSDSESAEVFRAPKASNKDKSKRKQKDS